MVVAALTLGELIQSWFVALASPVLGAAAEPVYDVIVQPMVQPIVQLLAALPTYGFYG